VLDAARRGGDVDRKSLRLIADEARHNVECPIDDAGLVDRKGVPAVGRRYAADAKLRNTDVRARKWLTALPCDTTGEGDRLCRKRAGHHEPDDERLGDTKRSMEP
jgi:hypothetical protein